MTAVEYLPAKAEHLEEIVYILNQHNDKGACTLWQRYITHEDLERVIQGFSDREGYCVVLKNDVVIGYGVIKKYHVKEVIPKHVKHLFS